MRSLIEFLLIIWVFSLIVWAILDLFHLVFVLRSCGIEVKDKRAYLVFLISPQGRTIFKFFARLLQRLIPLGSKVSVYCASILNRELIVAIQFSPDRNIFKVMTDVAPLFSTWVDLKPINIRLQLIHNDGAVELSEKEVTTDK